MSGKKVFISSNHTPSYFVYPPVGGYFDFCIQICHYNGGLSYKIKKDPSIISNTEIFDFVTLT